MDRLCDWSGQTAVIVASGPSAGNADLETVRGRAKLIAVNSSWRLAPWADVLYACDGAWWIIHGGVPEFPGLKVTTSHRAWRNIPGLHRLRVDGHNSGTQAIFLSMSFGSRRVVLVGFDMHCDRGVHWHGEHPTETVIIGREPCRLRNPGTGHMARWSAELDAFAQRFRSLGVEVINATPGSALKAYPYQPLEQAIGQ